MKKLYLLTLCLLSVVSAFADPIDAQRAMQIAQQFVVPGHIMKVSAKAKARKVSSKTAPYYIISRGEGQGYVIVSGDDALPEVLGYTEEGDFDPDNMPPFLTWFLDSYAQMAEEAQAVKAPRMVKAKAPVAGRETIAPMLKTHWHQTGPYNDFCPERKDGGGKCVTGCVATAASQIAYYWRKDLTPVTLAAVNSYESWGGKSYATRAFPKGTPLKWDLMLTQYGSEGKDYREAVATLLAVVGGGAKLDYASSTGGHNTDCRAVYSNVLGMNGGQENNKDWGEEYNNYSDEAWATLIYKDLIKSQPVLYSGCNEAGEGHAVVIDGYNAATGLFHFNLGWGGQSDGYYTTDRGKAPSWGFNSSWQECVTGISPKKFNLPAEIIMPVKVLNNVTNEFTVNVVNNSTLPYSGVYFFANTSGKAPTSLTSAKSSDKDVVIPVDGKASFTFTAKPTSDKTWYFIVTDKNLNVLAQVSAEPETAAGNLSLCQLSVDASTDEVEFGGDKYQVVYNSKSTAHAILRNESTLPYENSQRMTFYAYNEETSLWENIGYKTANFAANAKQTGDAVFSLLSTSTCPFEQGKYYKGVIENPVHGTNDMIAIDANADTIVRFVFKDADMEVVDFTDDVLTLKGHFDNTLFASATFAKKTAYKTAVAYDLTQCTGVGVVSQDLNPNAIYYVADDSEAHGTNVIKAGKCENLSLTMGQNFVARESFMAERAELKLNTSVAQWTLVTPPFNAKVPDGIIAREVNSHSSTMGISNRTTDVTSMEAGKAYLIMTSAMSNLALVGENTVVLTAPVENVDTAIVGSYVNTVVPAGAMLVSSGERQYFSPVEEGAVVPALGGYFFDSEMTKEIRAYSSTTLDPSYQELAVTINDAYSNLEKYMAMVATDTYEAYLDSIHKAEEVFSTRTLDTATKVKKYIEQLVALGSDYAMQIVNIGKSQVDFTGRIVNPSFETKNTTGWTVGTVEGVKTPGSAYVGTNANNYRSVGLDGSYVFQSLIATADSSSVGIEQEITDLIPGYYRLNVKVGTSEGRTVTVFAGDSITTVSAHSFGKFYLTEAVVDDVLVEATEADGTGKLRIGVKPGDWYKVDNFRLTCVGSLEPEEDPTAITAISASSTAKGTYTIMGTKVRDAVKPGLYIIDGKKTLVR